MPQLHRRAPGVAPAGRDGLRLGPGRTPTPGRHGNAYLSKVAARMYLPFGENFTKDTGGLSSSAWSTDVAAGGPWLPGGLPHHRPVRSPPRVRTLPPPTTRASMRAAPPRDPRTGALQEQRPWGQTASGGRAFRRPPATSPQGTEKASGWPSRTGLAHTQLPCGHSHQDSVGLKVLLKVTVGQRRFPLETTWLCHAHSPTPDWGGSAPGGPREAGRSCWLGRASLGGTWPGDRAAPACGGAPSAPW